MKFRLTFGVKDKNRTLPLNYQYEFASWIYKTIHGGSPGFSKWLHEQGYTSGHKTFKLFTFSNLFSEIYTIQNLFTKYTTLLPMHSYLNNVLSKQHEMEIKFRLTGNFRSQLVKIKADTADETLIKGFTYNFKISAPVELLQIDYFAGFGEKNSLGFGSVEVNNNPI